MGGSGIAADTREAASALRWWLEMGVDGAIQEQPRNWFAREAAAAPAPAQATELPDTLDAFRHWLTTSTAAPLFAAKSKPVLPAGEAEPEVMVLAEAPTRDDIASERPVGGEAAELLQRMLGAIGMAERAYTANLSCFPSPATRLSKEELDRCAAVARQHIALVKPKRLLLLGDAPSRALLGKPLLQARGHGHSVDGVRTVATFHPRQLLKRSSDKALAWNDLLLLTEGDQ